MKARQTEKVTASRTDMAGAIPLDGRRDGPSLVGTYSVEAVMASMELVPDGVVLCTLTGEVFWCNSTTPHVLRQSGSDLRGQSLSSILQQSKDPQPTETLVRQVLGDGQPREVSLYVPSENRAHISLQARAARVATSNAGNFAVVFLHDFTGQDEHRTQVQMYASELGGLYREARRYSKQVESLYAVAKLLSSEIELDKMLGKVAGLLDSLAPQKLTLGLATRNKGSRNFRMVVTHGAGAKALQYVVIPVSRRGSELASTLKEKRPVIFDLREPLPATLGALAREGSFASVSILPLITNHKIIGLLVCCSARPFVIAERDMPFYQGMAESLAVAIERAQLFSDKKQQLAQARELDETKRNLMGALSHDFRTPLTALQTSLELLSDPGAVQWGSEYQRRLIVTMKRSTARLDKLLSDLFDASQLRNANLKLERHPVKLEDLLKEITSFLLPGFLQRIEVKSPPDGATVIGDSVRLQQAISNIIDNAFKYSPPDSKVTVELRTLTKEARVVISDRGPGVPVAERHKIFQPFYRLERDQYHNGTGLGLSICKWLIELHGGKVWVRSRPGGGSRFYISLPIGGT
ncbi:MAG: PAS domain-containing protein [Chloroflexi bacterium]|nr:PAS domain-containing protein [Chloroflexota bacterium]